MSIVTDNLPSLEGYNSISSKHVLKMSDRLKVKRINASSVSAQVVKFQTFRNLTYQIVVCPNMGVHTEPWS